MKRIRTHAALWGLAALLLSACKASPPGSTLSLTATDATGKATTLTANDANSIFSARRSDAEGQTIVQICSDVGADGDCSRLVVMTIAGTAPGSYAMGAPTSSTQLVVHDGQVADAPRHYLGGEGSIEVTELGASAGEPVKGTFAATLACDSGCSGNVSVTGSFDIALSR